MLGEYGVLAPGGARAVVERLVDLAEGQALTEEVLCHTSPPRRASLVRDHAFACPAFRHLYACVPCRGPLLTEEVLCHFWSAAPVSALPAAMTVTPFQPLDPSTAA